MPVTVKAGAEIHVTTLVLVDSPSTTVIVSATGITPCRDVKQEFHKLAKEHGSHLTSTEEEQFLGLLPTYADIFVISNLDLDRTDKLRHQIFTGDAPLC